MGLREDLRSVPIRELAMSKAVTVLPCITVRQAAATMREERIGAVIVVDGAGLPVGMFTEKLLIRVMALRVTAMDEPVEQFMSRRCVCMREHEPIARLISTMLEHNLRWVCVVDEAGLPVGLTGLRGVIEHVVEGLSEVVKVQPLEAKLSMPEREGA